MFDEKQLIQFRKRYKWLG